MEVSSPSVRGRSKMRRREISPWNDSQPGWLVASRSWPTAIFDGLAFGSMGSCFLSTGVVEFTKSSRSTFSVPAPMRPMRR